MSTSYAALAYLDNFKEEIKTLEQIEQVLIQEHEKVKNKITVKENLIGNNALGLFNKIIALSYEVMMHRWNYKVYQDMMKSITFTDEAFLLQLHSLSLITKSLIQRHYAIEKDLGAY